MDIEDTSSFDSQPADVRTRRAAVLAGVGLVWAAFMASIGLLLVALLVLVAAAAGAAWILGIRLPRVDLRGVTDQARTSAATATGRMRSASSRAALRTRDVSVAVARASGTLSRRTVAASRVGGASAFGRSAAGIRATVGRASVTASLARDSVHRPQISRPRLNRRPDPRIEEALTSNSEGIALARAGKHAEAIDAFDAALTLLADTGDRHHEGQVLVNLGAVHRRVGGAEAARYCWTRALERLEPGTRESERTAELLGAR